MMTATEARDHLAAEAGQPWDASAVGELVDTLERTELLLVAALAALRRMELPLLYTSDRTTPLGCTCSSYHSPCIGCVSRSW